MNNKMIRLTESDIHKIVKETVNNFLDDVQPVPGYIHTGKLNSQQLQQIYTNMRRAYDIIREVMAKTEQPDDPYLKGALQYIAAYTRTLKGEADYQAKTTQVKY